MKSITEILLSVCIIFISLTLLLISIAGFEVFPIDIAILLVILSSITFVLATAAAVALDYNAGEYECKKCGYKFKPSLSAYICGAHTLTKRRLKCPHCGEKSFCKRCIS